MNTLSIKTLFVVPALIITLAAYSSPEYGAGKLDDKIDMVLTQMPQDDLAQLDTLMDELVSSGSKALAILTSRLIPLGQGDDTPVRFAIESLARYASAPGREKARKLVETSLLKALKKQTDEEVQTFLINRLNLVGADKSVKALTAFMEDADSNVAEPARQALYSIGTGKAVRALSETLQDNDIDDEGIRELTDYEEEDGFVMLFNGENLDGWQGNTTDYIAEDGVMCVRPSGRGSGNLYTDKEYGDFIFRFEFQLTPGANNGLGIRAPLEGDAAYAGMELQILDNTAAVYADLKEYQYHGSVYGVIPAKRGYLKPVGEWNMQEVIAVGTRITVILNGTVILDGDIAEASQNGTVDGRNHPGLLREKGYIGFLGHGSELKFRNIRIKDLTN